MTQEADNFKRWQVDQVVVAKDETIATLRARLEEAETENALLKQGLNDALRKIYSMTTGGRGGAALAQTKED